MSSFLCFVCHSTVNMDTNEETREIYKELVGVHLNQDSHLCHVCCHILNKFWLFRSVCLKRSMEYPVLFSEKGTIYLHINDIEHFNLCPNNHCQNDQRKVYHNPSYYFNDSTNQTDKQDGEIHKNNFSDYFNASIDNNEAVDNFNYNYHADSGNHVENQINDELEKQNINKFEYFGNYFDNNLVNDEKLIHVCNETGNICTNNLNVENETELNGDCLNEDDIKNLKNDITKLNEDVNYDSLDNSSNEYDSKSVTLTTTDEVSDKNDNTVKRKNKTDSMKLNEDTNLNDSLDTPNNEYESKNTTLIITEEENSKADKKVKKKKSKKNKSDFEKIVLTLEQQKAELERNRRQKKYIEAEFKCYNCAMGFLFKDTYQTHMMRHEESNGEYRCPTCTLRFVTPAVFRAHASLHTDRYKCNRCGQSMRLRRCKPHAITCGGNASEEVSCHLCGNVFKDSNGLSQHLRRFHKLRTKNRTYSCTVCGKTYNNQAAVRTHMIKHIQRQFHCERCPSRFSSPYMLNQHKKKHDATQQEQHYCTTCKVGYTTRKSLLAHKRNALAHQRTVFECRICARLCPNRAALATHTQRVHAPCKQYECNVCGKRYSTPPTLRRHEATHMPAKEAKVHMCHICPRTFKSRSKLNRHLREVCEKDKLEEELSIYYQQHALS